MSYYPEASNRWHQQGAVVIETERGVLEGRHVTFDLSYDHRAIVEMLLYIPEKLGTSIRALRALRHPMRLSWGPCGMDFQFLARDTRAVRSGHAMHEPNIWWNLCGGADAVLFLLRNETWQCAYLGRHELETAEMPSIPWHPLPSRHGTSDVVAALLKRRTDWMRREGRLER